MNSELQDVVANSYFSYFLDRKVIRVPSSHRIVKARRWFVAGLIISVLGGRIIDAGVDAFAAMSVLATFAVVAIKNIEEFIVFTFPAYAKILERFSPDKAMMFQDGAEFVLSVLAALLIWFQLFDPAAVLVAYVLAVSLLWPITDIADEFYAAQVALADEEAALAINARVDTYLAVIGFVLAAPLGAIVAGIAPVWLFAVNAFVSAAGLMFRGYARRVYPVSPPKNVDIAEYSALGEGAPAKQFLLDLFRSGPASPLLSFVISAAAALCGYLFLLWTGSCLAGREEVGMAVVLAVFGCAGAIGPMLARKAKKRLGGSIKVLRLAALGTAANIALFLGLGAFVSNKFVLGLVFIFANKLIGSLRMVILNTYRMITFKGSQFSRIMSWSYAFSAAGSLFGLWLAYLLRLDQNPVISMLAAAGLWCVIAAVIKTPDGIIRR